MAAIHCANIDCGSKNDYVGVKPKFCGACGTPFDAAFKRVAPTFVAPASTTYTPSPIQQTQTQPQRPHVGSFQQHTCAPTPDQIVANVQLDNSCVHIEAERPQKLTVGALHQMGGGVSFDRPANNDPTLAGVRSMGDVKSTAFEHMLSTANTNPQQAPQPARSTRRSKRAK